MGSSIGFSLRMGDTCTYACKTYTGKRSGSLPTAEEEKQNQEAGFKKARGA
jgi:hypothetical protein